MYSGLFFVWAMDFDWLGRNLYIADYSLRKIFVCALKNAMCIDMGLPQSIQPVSLAVDSRRR